MTMSFVTFFCPPYVCLLFSLFFLYVCPSVCLCTWTQLCSHRRDFHEVLYCEFLIYVYFEKIQDRLKPDKITVFITWRRKYICNIISLNYSYNDKYFRQVSGENQNSSFVYSFFFLKSCIYERMCKKIQ